MKKRKWRWFGVAALVMLVPASGLWAQSVADDIQQLLLDVQKLSQLKQILTQMYTEYNMLHKGYEEIKGLSQGTFSLHKAFLDGLLLVSPAVSSYSKVGGIITKETYLISDYQSAKGYFQNSRLFTPQELDGFSTNYGTFLQRGQKDVDELTLVITDGDLRMSDGERLSAIDRIDADMTRQLSLLHSFNNTVAIQAAQRLQVGAEVGTVKGLYGIGP
jgi:hypothetical protein